MLLLSVTFGCHIIQVTTKLNLKCFQFCLFFKYSVCPKVNRVFLLAKSNPGTRVKSKSRKRQYTKKTDIQSWLVGKGVAKRCSCDITSSITSTKLQSLMSPEENADRHVSKLEKGSLLGKGIDMSLMMSSKIKI